MGNNIYSRTRIFKRYCKSFFHVFISKNRKILLKDLLKVKCKIKKNKEHLAAVMKWLCNAQDANINGGISKGYDIEKNLWGADYPEITGYIIPTFFDYYHFTKQEEFKFRAIQMAEWECNIQLSAGAIQAGRITQRLKVPAVFNTGQVILGWVRAYKETNNSTYLKSLKKKQQIGCLKFRMKTVHGEKGVHQLLRMF